MIEYARVILPKVCNWKNLYKKELLKCVEWAGEHEINELRKWCFENFNEIYPDILDEVFAESVLINNGRERYYTSNFDNSL